MFRRLLCPAGRFFFEMTEPAAVAAGAPVGHDPTKWPTPGPLVVHHESGV
jgi:hypothetical protein